MILRDKLRPADAGGRAGALVDGWSRGLADHTPAAVEQTTGVKAARVERLAHELAEQRPSVAIIGGAALAQGNGLFQALAVNALNALLGSVDAPAACFARRRAAPARPLHQPADILADKLPVGAARGQRQRYSRRQQAGASAIRFSIAVRRQLQC